jgi:eukaryotic-like serine/threonine-protein kinase
VSVGGRGPAQQKAETIGKYRIVEPIGRGGMGMIFKAHDPILDRLVAVKVISLEVEVSDDLRTRFFREAKACAKLNHPNIVTVHDMGEDAGRLFIVMELLQGEELRQIIKANTPLALDDKLSLIRQVCRGLHYAHQQGVVHRDMKPANIFVLRSRQVKILDFGIAQLATTDPGLTRTGLIMGTLRYISPEQVRGRVDHRSDMFSLGSVLYELLTSRPPFLGEDPLQILEQLRSEDPPAPTQIDPTIPPELEAVVRRAMRKDPAERYRDLDEMGAALEAVHAGVIERRRARSEQERQDEERQAVQRGYP